MQCIDCWLLLCASHKDAGKKLLAVGQDFYIFRKADVGTDDPLVGGGAEYSRIVGILQSQSTVFETSLRLIYCPNLPRGV